MRDRQWLPGSKIFFLFCNIAKYSTWEIHSGVISSFSPAEGFYYIYFVNLPVPYKTNRGLRVYPEYIYSNREEAIKRLESMNNQRISACKKTIKDMLETISCIQKTKQELENERSERESFSIY